MVGGGANRGAQMMSRYLPGARQPFQVSTGTFQRARQRFQL